MSAEIDVMNPGEIPKEKGLAKSLTLFNGITMIIGCIIGSGIFVSPTGVQEKAGSVGLSLIVWASSGIFIAISAYCYAELGTLIKKSGGDYTYILDAFGPFAGFIRLWIEAIVVRPCTVTIVSLTFAIYILRPFYPHCDIPPGVTPTLAILLITLMTAINCLSVRLATIIQDVLTVAKVAALALIIGTGIYLLSCGDPQYWDSFEFIWEDSARNFADLSLAFYAGLFAYSGWNYLNFIVEELQNPKRNLPLAIYISISTCTIIYVLTNVALYAGISPDEMLESPAVAVLFANKFFGPVAFLMPFFVACSTVGTANGVIFTSARLFYSGAREGQMPVLLTMINKRTRTPIPAVIATGLMSIFYLTLSDNVYQLINYIQMPYFLATGGAILALLRFRRTMPHAPRPIKVALVWPVISLLGCIALVFVPIYAAPIDAAISLAIMLTAVPVYFVFVAWENKPAFFAKGIEAVTVFLQKLFVVVDEPKDD